MDSFLLLQTALWEIRAKWYNLGVALGFSPGDLDAIETDNYRKTGACLTELLKRWLNLQNQSLDSLRKALKLPQMRTHS